MLTRLQCSVTRTRSPLKAAPHPRKLSLSLCSLTSVEFSASRSLLSLPFLLSLLLPPSLSPLPRPPPPQLLTPQLLRQRREVTNNMGADDAERLLDHKALLGLCDKRLQSLARPRRQAPDLLQRPRHVAALQQYPCASQPRLVCRYLLFHSHPSQTCMRARTQAHARKRTHASARTQAHARKRTHTQARTHKHARTQAHARTHIRTHVRSHMDMNGEKA